MNAHSFGFWPPRPLPPVAPDISYSGGRSTGSAVLDWLNGATAWLEANPWIVDVLAGAYVAIFGVLVVRLVLALRGRY